MRLHEALLVAITMAIPAQTFADDEWIERWKARGWFESVHASADQLTLVAGENFRKLTAADASGLAFIAARHTARYPEPQFVVLIVDAKRQELHRFSFSELEAQADVQSQAAAASAQQDSDERVRRARSRMH